MLSFVEAEEIVGLLGEEREVRCEYGKREGEKDGEKDRQKKTHKEAETAAMIAPRTFTIRHGETEWSKASRLTGMTDLALTKNGEKRIKATGKAFVGNSKLISPNRIAHV